MTGLFVLALGCAWIAGCGGAGTSSNASGAGGSAGSGYWTGGTTNSAGAPGSGGSSSSDACGSFIPCGGDILGTWHVARFCIATETAEGAPTTLAACADMYTSGVADENVAMTFSADGTVALTTLPDVTQATRTYTPECLSSIRSEIIAPEDMPTECANLNVDDETSTGHLVSSCTMNDANCVCNFTFTVSSEYAESFPYTTSGSTVTLDGDDLQYCVEGDTFKFGSAADGYYYLYTR